MADITAGRLQLSLPSKWAVTTLMVHFEGEDLTQEKSPFAANMVVQYRLESRQSPTDAAAADAAALKATLGGFTLIGRGELTVGGHPVSQLEFSFKDSEHTLRQLVIYCPVGDRLHTVTCTHVDGRFEAVRPAALQLAQQLMQTKVK